MEILTPVLKQIAIRPGNLRQPTIKEFFKFREITEDEKVAKIRSKRMQKVILHMKGKETETEVEQAQETGNDVPEECGTAGTEIAQNKPAKRARKDRKKRAKREVQRRKAIGH